MSRKSQFWCKPLVFLVLKKALKLLPVMFWVIVFLFLYLVSLLESTVASIFKQSSESEHKVWLLPLKNSSCYQQPHRPTPVIQQSLIRPLFLPLCSFHFLFSLMKASFSLYDAYLHRILTGAVKRNSLLLCLLLLCECISTARSGSMSKGFLTSWLVPIISMHLSSCALDSSHMSPSQKARPPENLFTGN